MFLTHSDKENDKTVGLEEKLSTADDADSGYVLEVGVKIEIKQKKHY